MDEIKKIKVYEKMIGFVPEVIIVLSAGTIKDTNGKLRSTSVDEADAFGTLFGEARVIATAELAKYFIDAKVITTSVGAHGELTTAAVLREELIKLSISSERIILEEKSTNSLTQIRETLKIALENKWKNIVFVTNEYHLNRVRAMYEYLVYKDEDIKVLFIGAESILPHRDPSFIKIIEEMKKTDAYQNRIKNEERGIKDIINGTYGQKSSKPDDKIERKIA